MTTALYARVSTADKDQDPETQLRILREWAARTRPAQPTREYVDHASAVDFNARTAWNHLMADVRAHAVQTVVVLRYDRAFRSAAHLSITMAELQHAGAEFVATQQGLDTATPHGRFTMRVLVDAAELERDLTVQRIHEGMARARANGKHIGRPRRRRRYAALLAELKANDGRVASTARAMGISRTSVSQWMSEMRSHRKYGPELEAAGL